MLSYLDTSAIAKRYLQEPGSQTFLNLLSQMEIVVTSVFTELELLVMVERAKKMRRIDSPMYRALGTAIRNDFSSDSITQMQISRDIIGTAKKLVRSRTLRAADAIQLASALAATRKRGLELHFIGADQALLEAARLEGLQTHDVSK